MGQREGARLWGIALFMGPYLRLRPEPAPQVTGASQTWMS
mgnify:FL=1